MLFYCVPAEFLCAPVRAVLADDGFYSAAAVAAVEADGGLTV